MFVKRGLHAGKLFTLATEGSSDTNLPGSVKTSLQFSCTQGKRLRLQNRPRISLKACGGFRWQSATLMRLPEKPPASRNEYREGFFMAPLQTSVPRNLKTGCLRP